MHSDESTARREASHWYVRLREEAPEDHTARADFEAWLAADPSHGAAWRSMQETMDIARQASRHGDIAPTATLSRKRRITARARRTSASSGRRIAVGRLAGAAIAALLFVLAMPSLMLHIKADYISAAGELQTVALPDGSSVQLGPSSAIAVHYTAAGRAVELLRGQALFDVRHDAARPFTVASRNLSTRVLGTRFDVRMVGAATSVSVNRGHVQVADRTRSSGEDLLVGDWVTISSDLPPQRGRIAPELVGAWAHREILADNRAIGSLVDEIRPWYKGRIVVTDSALAARKVTGIYNMQDPETALAMILKPYGGRITRITPWLLIVSAS